VTAVLPCACPSPRCRRAAPTSHVLDGHIFGFSVWETSHTYTDDQAAQLGAEFERITADGCPHVREHPEQHATAGPHQQVRAFDFGLGLVLEGPRRIPRRTTAD
jgi:hypothetical protein